MRARRFLGLWLGLWLGLAACREEKKPLPTKLRLTSEQKADGKRRIDETVTRIAQLEKRRDAAFASLAGLRPGTAPCPIDRAALGIGKELTGSALTLRLLGMTRIVAPDAKKPSTGAMSTKMIGKAAYLEQELDGEHGYGETADEYLAALSRKLDAIRPEPYELALILDKLVQPKVIDDKTYAGGRTRGTLYLWSESAGAIVCAAAVGDRSADQLTYTKHAGLSASLDGQLVVATIDSGLDRLRAIAPTPAAPTP